jgi:hypothetical protein
MRDLLNQIHTIRALSPAATPADNTVQVSQIIDHQGFDSLTFAILTGAIPDADATYSVAMFEADDAAMATETAVAAADIVGTLALAAFIFSDDDKVFKVGYTGAKRYVRIKITPVNNTGASLLAVVAILGHPAIAPTANPPQ